MRDTKQTKLRTSHILPYLCHAPIGFIGDDRETIYLLSGINAHDKTFTTLEGKERHISEFVPILHPIRSLVGIDQDVEQQVYFDIVDHGNLPYLSLAAQGIVDFCLSDYDILCRNKIDFMRLIDKGMAVSINDVAI